MVDTGRVDVTHLNTTVIIVAGQISVVAPEQPPSPPHFTVVGEGEVTAVSESWEIGGQTFTTNEATILIGNPQIGDIVTVWGYLLPDGTLVATHIILRHPAPTPSITFVGAVESMEDGEWVVAGQTLLIDDDTYLDVLIALGDVVRVYATIQADGSLLVIHLLMSGIPSSSLASSKVSGTRHGSSRALALPWMNARKLKMPLPWGMWSRSKGLFWPITAGWPKRLS